jgi:hypothetical protein
VTNLGSAKHHSVEKNFEFLESEFAWPTHSRFLNGRQDFVVPEAGLNEIIVRMTSLDCENQTYVLHWAVTTIYKKRKVLQFETKQGA